MRYQARRAVLALLATSEAARAADVMTAVLDAGDGVDDADTRQLTREVVRELSDERLIERSSTMGSRPVEWRITPAGRRVLDIESGAAPEPIAVMIDRATAALARLEADRFCWQRRAMISEAALHAILHVTLDGASRSVATTALEAIDHAERAERASVPNGDRR